MNASPVDFYFRWQTAVGVALIGAAVPVSALDWAAPLADPLQTLPPLIDAGAAVLPGDSAPVGCPVVKDFAIPLTLMEAVDLALCNNPQIMQTWAGIKVQAGAVGEARAAYFPVVTAAVNRIGTNTTFPGSGVPAVKNEGNTLNASLGWRLFDFGGREADRKAADSLLNAAVFHHDAALQKTLTQVIAAYFDAQTAAASVQAKKLNERIAASTFASAQRREARGAVSRGDILQATTSYAKATLEKNRAAGAYQKALAVLAYSIGSPPLAQLSLATDGQDAGAAGTKTLTEWLDIAQKAHPSIEAARAEWEASKQKIISVRSEGLPTLDFSANYYRNSSPGQTLSSSDMRQTTVGITLNIPIFRGFAGTYKLRGAQAQAEQREAQLQDMEHNILMEVVRAYADADASLLNLQASEKLLAAAQASLEMSQRKYDKGAADILEILSTQTALSDAQEQRIQSLSEWRSARLRLLASAGMMGRIAAGR